MAAYGDRERIKAKTGLTYTDLGLDTEADLDDLIDDMNAQASQLVEAYCQRDFLEHTNDQLLMDGTGRNTFMTPDYPIISIASLKLSGVELVVNTDYRIKVQNSYGGNSGIIEKRFGIWTMEWQTIDLTYTWGYTTPPDAIVQVVEEMIITFLKASSQTYRGKGVKSIGMEGFSVSFQESKEASQVLANHKDKLDLFRRAIIV
ncbi:MAG: hypothetical protein DRO11_02220 [Methanobacteriota archaeon]|nr:MAG: hypothetical protein DRO11_02220 [Euryarchaeota archaeon]